MSSTIHQLVTRIVDYESRQLPAPLTPADSAMRICEKLRLQLTPLIGTAGYHALITRSLALLTKDEPWNEHVRIQPDGAITLTPRVETPARNNLLLKDAVPIPAQILTLLATFIGEALAVNLALEIWPLPPTDEPSPTRQAK